jgi:hypothetical protein
MVTAYQTGLLVCFDRGNFCPADRAEVFSNQELLRHACTYDCCSSLIKVRGQDDDNTFPSRILLGEQFGDGANIFVCLSLLSRFAMTVY